MLRYLPFLLVLAVWIYAFIDVLNTPEKEVRHLPKVVWVIIVLLFGEVLLGPIAWFVTGKVRHAPGAGGVGARGRGRWVAPDDNPEFLKSLRDESKSGDDGGAGGHGDDRDDRDKDPGENKKDTGGDA
ncbi:PLD nuclease N-terminal domain-containing protein [Streptomyces sp. NPDC002564]|uniref:PLD nuclease N-terminal domain-containing protein n=1 Tax=Streptomyces sp. NPDC002564 TaxID=3364649 RepID=UPI00369F5374